MTINILNFPSALPNPMYQMNFFIDKYIAFSDDLILECHWETKLLLPTHCYCLCSTVLDNLSTCRVACKLYRRLVLCSCSCDTAAHMGVALAVVNVGVVLTVACVGVALAVVLNL